MGHRVWDTGTLPCPWEGDLIFGSHNSRIATLVERHTAM